MRVSAMLCAGGLTLPRLFAAPEQLDDDGSYFDNKISLKADIWGVGCILLQCLTGRPPWDKFSDHKVLLEVVMLVWVLTVRVPGGLHVGSHLARNHSSSRA